MHNWLHGSLQSDHSDPVGQIGLLGKVVGSMEGGSKKRNYNVIKNKIGICKYTLINDQILDTYGKNTELEFDNHYIHRISAYHYHK